MEKKKFVKEINNREKQEIIKFRDINPHLTQSELSIELKLMVSTLNDILKSSNLILGNSEKKNI